MLTDKTNTKFIILYTFLVQMCRNIQFNILPTDYNRMSELTIKHHISIKICTDNARTHVNLRKTNSNRYIREKLIAMQLSKCANTFCVLHAIYHIFIILYTHKQKGNTFIVHIHQSRILLHKVIVGNDIFNLNHLQFCTNIIIN